MTSKLIRSQEENMWSWLLKMNMATKRVLNVNIAIIHIDSVMLFDNNRLQLVSPSSELTIQFQMYDREEKNKYLQLF